MLKATCHFLHKKVIKHQCHVILNIPWDSFVIGTDDISELEKSCNNPRTKNNFFIQKKNTRGVVCTLLKDQNNGRVP